MIRAIRVQLFSLLCFLVVIWKEVERNYWSIELEIVDIVWIIRKIRHMIKFIEISSIIIYTNHFVAVSINRQITLTIFNSDKLNLRLVRASQYLFDFNLFVRHKADKVNVVSDVLSRLQADVIIIDKIDVFESLYEHILKLTQANLTLETSLYFHHVVLVKMSNDFKIRLKQAYLNDEHWFKILVIVRFAVVITSTTSITFAHEAIATNETTSTNAIVSTIEITRTTIVVLIVRKSSHVASCIEVDENTNYAEILVTCWRIFYLRWSLDYRFVDSSIRYIRAWQRLEARIITLLSS